MSTAGALGSGLTGAGLAAYSKKIAPYHQKVNGENIEIFHHPHNIFLTMWVNLGILGLIGFVWILVWFFSVALSRNNLTIGQFNNSTIIPFLAASMITLLTTGLVDSPYIKNDLSIFFWALMTLLVISRSDNLKIKI